MTRRAAPAARTKLLAKLLAKRLSLPPDPVNGTPALSFTLVRDTWSSIRISVRPDGGVLVKTPRRLRDGDALRAVARRRAWIQGKLDFFASLPVPEAHAYRPGEHFFVLGRALTLRYCPPPPHAGFGRFGRFARPAGPRRVRAVSRDDTLELHWQGGGEPGPDKARQAVLAWRKETARAVLGERLAAMHSQACHMLGGDTSLPPWRVRRLKRRWGSCSRRGELSLAVQLSALPAPLADYVIAHELCHLRRFDHSPEFHRLLETLLPGHRRLERELRGWSLARVTD